MLSYLVQAGNNRDPWHVACAAEAPAFVCSRMNMALLRCINVIVLQQWLYLASLQL